MKPATTPPSNAVEVPLRLDNVAPGVAFEAAPDRDPGSDLPETVAATITDGHSGPAGGEISFRRLGAENWAELPTKFARDGAADSARLVAAHPAGPRAGHLPVPGGRGGRGGQHRFEHASRRRHRDGAAQGRGSRPAGARAAASLAKTRLFARLRWRHRSGPRITVPFDAAAILSGRLVDADGAGLAGRALRVVSRPSRGALAESRESTRSAPDRTAASGCRSRRGRRGASPSASPARTASTARVAPASRCGCAAGSSLSASPSAVRTGEVVRFSGRVNARGAPIPRRGKLVAIQYYESAARRWRPVLFVRSDRSGHFRARYRFRYVSGSARIRFRAVALAEERWPYSTGASAPLVIRVSG